MTIGEWIILLIIASIGGALMKAYQKQSRNKNDLHKYKDIDDVIKKFGPPDDVKKFDDYTKYTFKKSTNGWSHQRHKVHIFTLQKGKLIKHETFQE